MIIKNLRLNPFAGTANREFVFTDNLNIVLGPNESGKSTFVNALLSALFVSTDQSDARLKKFYSNYLPKTGGDTINVDLGFSFDNTEFRLSKSWGATRSSKLSAGDSAVYTSPEEISGRMQKILNFNQGTYENVLVIRQSFLTDTINSIQSEAGASESIQKILRNSRFNMDGISVSRLKKLTEENVLKYFEHWDTDAEKPEGGRDIDREWKRGVGLILSAYYDYRRAEEKFKSAVKYETDLDELIKRIEKLTEETACLETYVQKYRQPYEDLNGRRILELKQDKLEKEIAELIDIQKRWPKLETEIDYLTREISSNSERLEILSKEKKNAEQYEAQRSLRKMYEKARPVYDQFLEEKEKLAGLPKVTPADIQAMNQAVRKQNECRIRFEAQKLRIKIQARQNFSAQLKAYLGESEKIELKGDTEFDRVLSGSIGLETEQFKLSVMSGDGDSAKILNDLREAKKNYQNLLAHYSIQNESELNARAEIYTSQMKAAEAKSTQLAAILEGKSFQEVERQYEALDDIPVQRPLTDIVQEYASLSQRIVSVKNEKNEKSKIIENWTAVYKNSDAVFDIHADKKIELNKITAEIGSMKPMPSEFTDADKFIADFKQHEAELKLKTDQLTAEKIRRAEFEKQEPEASAEEYESEMLLTAEHFEKVKKEGMSYLLIQNELNSLLDELDGDTFEPLQNEVSRLVAELTVNKYTSLSMDEIIPYSVGNNGSGIPVELLSAGTKDILALALRLGMASFYLNGRQGFIIMDDPLVNLDTARQQAAVECIRSAAKRFQIILLTCHPSHAELFKSPVISLG